MSFGSGSSPRSRAMRCASVVCSPSPSPSSSPEAGSGGGGAPAERSGLVPPRAGSGSWKINQASTNAGKARITNAARQDNVAIPPVTLKPIAAPTSSPERT
jgi:hypothetical protein